MSQVTERKPGAGRMTVTVKLFAALRERFGADAIQLDLAEGATVAEALRLLAQPERLGGMLDPRSTVMAVNREYADPGRALEAGDELALIPPLSGG